MANFCLPKDLTAPFLQALKSGRLNPMKLAEADSATRRKAFAEVVGDENAREVNALFESKLLLKNQQAGIIRWARSVGGLSQQAARDLFGKLEKLDRVLSPESERAFLNDLANKKLGAEVTVDEARTISDMSRRVQETEAAFEATGKSGVGAAKRALERYVSEITRQGGERQFVNPFREEGVGGKAAAVRDDALVLVRFIADNSRAIVASVDNSLWFRQGMRVAADPRFSRTWARNFAKSWLDIARTMGGRLTSRQYSAVDKILNRDAIDVGEAIKDGIIADVYESSNFLNGRYSAKVGSGPAGTKLDIGVGEESYPTSLPAKIPLLGRFFKGAETAYEAGAMRLRIDIADQVYAWAERTGMDMADNKVVGDLNEVINGMTGRGSFGRKVGDFEKSVNSAFFSIKFFKSNFDYLTLHQGRLATPATRLAATNLLYTVAVTYAMLEIAKALWPDDNEDIFNATSPNFGKMRFGDVTFDLTHGAGGLVVTAGRIITQQTTSGRTGKVTELGESFGAPEGQDIFFDFLANKFSPMFSAIREVVNQRTFEGDKPTVAGTAAGLITPITIQNVERLSDQEAGLQFLGVIADGLGIGTNVYK